MQRLISLLLFCIGLSAQPFQLNDPALLAATRPKSSAIPDDTTGILLWLRADSGCFTDAGKTTPCTDGTTAYVIADNSANHTDFTQSVSAQRATWHSGNLVANPLPVLSFLGSASQGYSGTPSAASGNYTAFLVFTPVSQFGGQYIFDSQTGRLIIGARSATTGDSGWFDGAWREGSGTLATNQLHLITYQLNSTGTSGNVTIDGANVVNAVYTAKAIGGSIGFGGNFSLSGSFITGYVGEFRLYPSDIGATRIATVTAYLKNKWGTP